MAHYSAWLRRGPRNKLQTLYTKYY